MFTNLLNYLKKVDADTYQIIKKGLKFSFVLCILSAILLFAYTGIFISPYVYYIGLSLFKLSCYLGLEFIVCGLVMDTIKKKLI